MAKYYGNARKRMRLMTPNRSRSRSSSISSGLRRWRNTFNRGQSYVRLARRIAGKRGRSRTRRSTTNSVAQLNEPDGMGGSTSTQMYKFIGSRYLKGFKAVAAPLSYRYTGFGRISCNTGEQRAANVVDLMDGRDLVAIANLLTPTSVDGWRTMRALISNAVCEVRFTNQSKSNLCLHLYDIIPRRDVTVAAEILADPILMWRQGYTDSNDSTSPDVISDTNLMATPFESAAFCQWYKVLRVRKLIVAQGCVHIHRVKVFGHKFFSPEKLGYVSGGANPILAFLRGITKMTMAVVSGFPLNDETTKTNVSTAAVSLDWVSSVRIQAQGFSGSLKHMYWDSNLPVIASSYVMDKGSGEAEVNVNA